MISCSLKNCSFFSGNVSLFFIGISIGLWSPQSMAVPDAMSYKGTPPKRTEILPNNSVTYEQVLAHELLQKFQVSNSLELAGGKLFEGYLSTGREIDLYINQTLSLLITGAQFRSFEDDVRDAMIEWTSEGGEANVLIQNTFGKPLKIFHISNRHAIFFNSAGALLFLDLHQKTMVSGDFYHFNNGQITSLSRPLRSIVLKEQIKSQFDSDVTSDTDFLIVVESDRSFFQDLDESALDYIGVSKVFRFHMKNEGVLDLLYISGAGGLPSMVTSDAEIIAEVNDFNFDDLKNLYQQANQKGTTTRAQLDNSQFTWVRNLFKSYKTQESKTNVESEAEKQVQEERQKEIGYELMEALKSAEAKEVSYLITKLFSCATEKNAFCLDGLIEIFLDTESGYFDPVAALKLLKSQGQGDTEQAKSLSALLHLEDEELQNTVTYYGASFSDRPLAPTKNVRTYTATTYEERIVDAPLSGIVPSDAMYCSYGTQTSPYNTPKRNIQTCVYSRLSKYVDNNNVNVTLDDAKFASNKAQQILTNCKGLPLSNTGSSEAWSRAWGGLYSCFQRGYRTVTKQSESIVTKYIPDIYSTNFAVHCLKPETFIDPKPKVKKLRVKNICDKEINVTVCWNHPEAIYNCRQTPQGPHSAGSYKLTPNGERVYPKSGVKLAGSGMPSFGAEYFKAIACFAPDIPINWDNYDTNNTFNCWSQSKD